MEAAMDKVNEQSRKSDTETAQIIHFQNKTPFVEKS